MEAGINGNLSVNVWAAGAFIGYLLLVIIIGLVATRFSSTGISEYFIGGRRMNQFVVALSAVVSGRSAWLLLGVTGMAYKMGASAVWAVVGYIIVEMLLFLFYAKRLRRFSETYDCITVPDFFAARLGDRGGWLRMLIVGIILIFMVSYISAQFIAGGKAFAASFQINQTTGILITAGIVLFYTMMGGFLAVSLTDMIQAIFMIMALVILPVVAIWDRGGLYTVVSELMKLDVSLVNPLALSTGALIGFLGIGLGSPGNPHIIARYMSIRDSGQLRHSAVIGTIWNVIMAWGALFIGMVGRVYFPGRNMLPGGDTEKLYPLLAQIHLHPVLFGVVIASIFAAIMSTADSQILVAVSGLVRDIYEKLFRKNRPVSQKKLVFLSRMGVILLVVFSLVVGMFARNQIFWLVLVAWAGLGAAIGPTSILALYWKGTTRAGVMAGAICGSLVTIFWYYTPALKEIVYELVPAFFIAAAVTFWVSKYTKQPEDVDSMFRAMKSPEAWGKGEEKKNPVGPGNRST